MKHCLQLGSCISKNCGKCGGIFHLSRQQIYAISCLFLFLFYIVLYCILYREGASEQGLGGRERERSGVRAYPMWDSNSRTVIL